MSDTHQKSWLTHLIDKFARRVTHKSEFQDSINETQISRLEADIAHNLTKLRSVTVEDIMIPRADIIAATVKSTQVELAEIFKQSMHSRLPIYAATLDDIIGFVHIKDMINVLTKKDFHLKSVIRKVLFVSPSLRAMDLLYRMQSSSIHLAIVVDEYGGTDGLITIDDILKKIVGDIDDEFETEDDPTIILQADGTYLADARVFIDDVEKMLQVKFSEQEHAESDTLGGLIFSFIGRIPVRGEVITHYVGLEFHILEVDPRRIQKVMLIKK